MSGRAFGIILFAAALLARGQLVQVGPVDPKYCQNIRVKPNLVTHSNTHLSGGVRDVSGAPFLNSSVELRAFLSPTRQTTLRIVKTDSQGRFDLGEVHSGKYRLLASPTRAFLQAEALDCNEIKCELNIVLQASPSDQPDSQCPIR